MAAANDLTPEEKQIAAVLPRLDLIRKNAQSAGDLIVLAELDAWYNRFAAVIRRVRDASEDF